MKVATGDYAAQAKSTSQRSIVTMNDSEKALIFEKCTRFVSYHYPQTPRQVLLELAEFTNPEAQSDRYGQGELMTTFETEVANLLGKEAAVFMPSGTMCQQIALRIWADRRKTNHIAFHPTCHLELHEQKGYQLLHGLHGILVGSPHLLMRLEDLQKLAEPLAALLLELPQRELGGQLPSWEDLVAMTAWAKAQGIPTHMDGARLWESQPFYDRPYAEIANLFDTVYVSFYKILGGIAGSMLAGPAELIAESRVWQRRHGGNLIRLYPYVLSARKGLRERLGKMALYHIKALEIAAALTSLSGIKLVPNPPHTNMMRVLIHREVSRLEQAALEIAQETGILVFKTVFPTQLPDYQLYELVVGDATMDMSTADITAVFDTLLSKASH
ncbi:MAG: low specificity L-threonine aldolase [Chloroflexi bacterium]|nr:low specificity L-threonine aldolase [Chloroflexota bacterium]